jgi:hypothetical protein
MNYKEKAEELVEKFFSVIPVPDYDEYVNPLKTHKERAKQCALICVETEYHSLREQLFNLRSCGLIPNEKVYCHRLQELIDEEQQVKTEIEKL